MRFHNLLMESKYPNCSRVAKEFEISVRTMMRDIDFMKTRMGLPIQFDGRRNGYYYTRPVEHFPQLPISEAEVFALLVAHKAIAQYHGTPFARPLEQAFRKLTGQLDTSVQYSLGNLDEVLSFRPFAPEDADLETFQIITRGLKEKRALKFLYRNLGADKSHWRLAHPYHVACIENHWYLFAFDVKRSAMRTFALTRLRAPELLQERFIVSQKFSLNEYLRGSFNVFKGAEDYEVVIDFDPWATDLLRGRRWHPTQEMIKLPGKSTRLRMRLNSLEEAERWVLSWGNHATVVRPEVLARRIRITATNLQQKYSDVVISSAPLTPVSKNALPQLMPS